MAKYPHGKIHVEAFESFIFELCTFVILTVFNYFTKKTQNNIKYLNEHEEEIRRLVNLEKENENRHKKEHDKQLARAKTGYQSQRMETEQSGTHNTRQSQVEKSGLNETIDDCKHYHKAKKSKTKDLIK